MRSFIKIMCLFVLFVCLDAQSTIISPETELVVSKANFEINLVQRLNDDFFSTIRAKLNWGFDIRN